MLILLPPSETKREGGAGTLDVSQLHAPHQLGDARGRVRAALESLCAPNADEDAAAKALKLGVKNRGELARNRELGTSGVMPAIDRYTGVLYDALDAASLGAEARAWAGSAVRVQSALFGQIAALDLIPAYRLSASTRLPALKTTLKKLWAESHSGIESGRLVLDLRSKDYVALAPLRPGEGVALNVAQRAEDGQIKALNHFNKAAKGDLVRRLATTGRSVSSLQGLLDWAAAEELDLTLRDGVLTLVTELGAPARV